MPHLLALDIQGISLAPADPVPDTGVTHGLVVQPLPPDHALIAAVIDALSSLLHTHGSRHLGPEGVATMQALLTSLPACPSRHIASDTPVSSIHAQEALEALLVAWHLSEAGQRHTNEEYRMIDEILTLLKRLRGLTPAEAKAVQQAHADDPQQLMQDGYRGVMRESVEILRETDAAKREWEVRIVQAGISKNGRRYSAEVLRRAMPLFEGARVYTYDRLLKGRELFDHLTEEELRANPQGYAKDLAGFIKHPRMQGADLLGTLVVFKGAQWLHDNLEEAFALGQPTLYGLSIDAGGDGHFVMHGSENVLNVDAINEVRSVDVVTYPAAGGQFLRLVASRTPIMVGGQDMPELTELEQRIALGECRLALREALDDSGLPPDVRAAIKQQFDGKLYEATALKTTITEAKVAHEQQEHAKALKEAAEQQLKTDAIDAKLQEAIDKVTKRYEDAEGRLKLRECAALLKEQLAGCQLPIKAQEKLERQFKDRLFEAKDLETAITEMRDLVASLDDSGTVRLPGEFPTRIRMGESEPDKIMLALDGFWAGEDLPGEDKRKVSRFRSLKEAWAQIMRRDWDVQEVLRESVAKKYDSHGRVGVQAERMAESRGQSIQQRFAEALTSSSWAQILGDSITRRMMAEYVLDELQDWRLITSEIGNVTDFRSQRRMRVGGYGVLPVVTQGDAYTELTSPTDQEATYSITKKGGLETITLEALANDDVGMLRRLPQRLGRAAGETLYRAVFDPINDNAALTYDDDPTALFTAGHGNLQTLALTAANLDTTIQDMMAQTAYGNSREYLRLRPAIMLHVRALWRTAFRLTNTESGEEPETTDRNANSFRQFGIRRIQVDYWTSTTKYILVADPRKVPTIEVGFFNGNEDPELFVADQENVGGSSQFSADKIAYKIRHIYGVAILEHRSFARGNA